MEGIVSGYKFDIPKHHKSIIKVIGVGGGGSNAVNHMYQQGIKDVEFVVANTDLQALNSSPVPHKLQMGTALTEGLGCGANPDVGQAAAMESKDEIREMLAGTRMVFITAGMGGGTGTGAAPVIAKIAKDMEILTVGIVTVPFSFEGKKKTGLAGNGIDAMREACDTVLVILNDKLREIYGNLPIGKAFSEADNVLTTAAKGIAEIITRPGYVNVDFQDVRTVMLNAGGAVMGSAETRGDDRALRAAQEALASPLLDNHETMGANKILLSIISGEEEELQMDELTTITEYIQEQSGEEAEVIFGHAVDAALTDRIRVTVIATGFQPQAEEATVEATKQVHDLREGQTPLFGEVDDSATRPKEEIKLKHIPSPRLEDEPPASNPELEIEDLPLVSHAASPDVANNMYQEETASTDEAETPEEQKEQETYAWTEQEIFVEKEVPVEQHAPIEQKVQVDQEIPVEQEKKIVAPPSVEQTRIYNFDIGAKPENPRSDDEFNLGKGTSADQVINDEGMMEVRQTKNRLAQQRRERLKELQESRLVDMPKEEFNEKWTVPAYLRRGIEMGDTPHSSEPTISRFKLNDENQLTKSNKYLHDNVD